MTFTMYGRTLLLKAMFTADTVVLPDHVEVALTLTVPPANAETTQLFEPGPTTSYARVDYALVSDNWTTNGFGDLFNTDMVEFAQVEDTWGLLVGWALVDPDSGQVLNCGPLFEPIATTSGMIPQLPPGSVVLSIQD